MGDHRGCACITGSSMIPLFSRPSLPGQKQNRGPGRVSDFALAIGISLHSLGQVVRLVGMQATQETPKSYVPVPSPTKLMAEETMTTEADLASLRLLSVGSSEAFARDHCLCAQRREQKARAAGCDVLCTQALQPTPTTGENPQLPALAADMDCCSAVGL